MGQRRPWMAARRLAGGPRRRWLRWRRRRDRHRRDPHVVALDVVRRVERAEPCLPRRWRPHLFTAEGRALLAPVVPDPIRSLLPLTPTAPLGVPALRAAVAAEAVVLAKFDLVGSVKLRAAYAGPGLTLAVNSSGEGARIARAVRAHEVVSAVDPGLLPRLVAHGVLPDGVPYLVEEWIAGTPLTATRTLADAIPELLTRLRAVQVAHGLHQVEVATWWDALRRDRWAQTVETGVVPEAVVGVVARWLDSGGTVSRSWCHGDLVASNVVRTDAGHALVDWERAGEAPVMLDAAKLHLFSSDPARSLDDILRLWSWTPAPGELAPREQLALAHAFYLSGYAVRRASLLGHHRAEVYERQVRRQIQRLSQVLDLSDPPGTARFER